MSSTGSHIGKGGQFRNNAHSSHVMGMAPGNGVAPQQQGFVQRPIQSRGLSVAGLQQPPYSDQLFPGMHTSAEEVSPVSLSFGDLAVNTQNRVPSSSAPYSNPAFPPNFNHQPGIPILNPLGHGGAHNLTRPSGMRPALFPMPSGPLSMPQAMVNGPNSGMMNPHMMMLPGMSPPFYLPQQPLGNIQQPENADVLSHMHRKKNVLKFFPADDSQPTESTADAQSLSASAPAPAPAVAPPADALPSVAKTDDPSPRTATSVHSSGGSPRAVAPNASAVSFAGNHPQHHAVVPASDHSSAPNESAASASRADDTKTPSAGVASASQHSSKHPHSQNTSRTSMHLLGTAISPSAPAPQLRPTPSAAAHRVPSTAASSANSQATSLAGAGRTVYTRELLLDLQKKPHAVSAQILDRINKLNLGLNCAPSAGGGVQGGRASNQPPPFPQQVGRRLPMGNKVGGAPSVSSSRVPQQKHCISENSFVAQMQKMSADGVEKKKKNIQLILNQLTSENFEKLCEKLYKEIDSVEVLEIVQTKIYDKAVLDQQQNPAPGQPTFVELYARVCLIIVQDNQRSNPATGEPGKLFFHPDQPSEEAKGGQFRRSLLNRCQEEFERPSHGRSEGWQQLSEVDRYNQQMKEKRRTLGNVDFVGQLFLHGLLAEKTLHHCFKLLLEKHYQIFDFFNQPGSPQPQDSDFDQLESFCKLLTTVGRTVDRPQAKQFMDSYFSYLQQIMGQPTIIPRMKFHIEQIVELRRCGWDQASMRENRSMPSSTSKVPKASVTLLLKPMPGNGTAKPAPVLVQPKPAPTTAPTGGKPSSASKQPQSSKVVNASSRPISGNSNGFHSSSVPTAPKADLMSITLAHLLEHRDTPDTIDAQHVRSLESMLAEWKCNHIHSEVADCLCELNQPYTHALFVHDIVTQCCDGGPSFFIKCAELLETLSRKPNCLNQDKLEEALRLLGSTEFEKDMSLDVPGYLDFFALIVARGLFFKSILQISFFRF
jgi:hypothetical protein